VLIFDLERLSQSIWIRLTYWNATDLEFRVIFLELRKANACCIFAVLMLAVVCFKSLRPDSLYICVYLKKIN
jgi:hypothetical protein